MARGGHRRQYSDDAQLPKTRSACLANPPPHHRSTKGLRARAPLESLARAPSAKVGPQARGLTLPRCRHPTPARIDWGVATPHPRMLLPPAEGELAPPSRYTIAARSADVRGPAPELVRIGRRAGAPTTVGCTTAGAGQSPFRDALVHPMMTALGLQTVLGGYPQCPWPCAPGPRDRRHVPDGQPTARMGHNAPGAQCAWLLSGRRRTSVAAGDHCVIRFGHAVWVGAIRCRRCGLFLAGVLVESASSHPMSMCHY